MNRDPQKIDFPKLRRQTKIAFAVVAGLILLAFILQLILS